MGGDLFCDCYIIIYVTFTLKREAKLLHSVMHFFNTARSSADFSPKHSSVFFWHTRFEWFSKPFCLPHFVFQTSFMVSAAELYTAEVRISGLACRPLSLIRLSSFKSMPLYISSQFFVKSHICPKKASLYAMDWRERMCNVI